MSLADLRERRRLAQEAVEALAQPSGTSELASLYEAHAAYDSELGSLLADATAGSDDTDLPPGWAVSDVYAATLGWMIGFDGSWDDEFTAPNRDRARLECWARFARSDTAWAERLLALLTFRVPEVPELPPGYEIGDCEDGTWAIRVDGSYHDGLDEIPTTREEAIEVAWNDWWRWLSEEWREFMTKIGAFADEDEE